MYKTIIDCLNNSNYHFEKKDITFKNVNYKNASIAEVKYIFDEKTYQFICIKYLNNNTPLGTIYLNNVSTGKNILIENNNSYFIDVSPKLYCIELSDKLSNDNIKTYLNWINYGSECDLPRSVKNICKSLEGMMRLIFSFLSEIKFIGPLYLDDDSMIGNIKTIIPRLLTGKKSIYDKFGFVTSYENNNRITELVDQLKNIKINDKIIGEGIKEHVNNNGTYDKSMASYLEQMRKVASSIMNEIQKLHEGMVLKNITKYPTDCPSIQYGAYYNKYLKYKKKYLAIKNT